MNKCLKHIKFIFAIFTQNQLVMKKLMFSLLVILVVTSCSKWKTDNNLTYYSEDYKEKEMTIINVPSSEIDALWFEFYDEGKNKEDEYTTYTLIAKSNGAFTKETGSCVINWKTNISFTSASGQTYIGTWIGGDKDKFQITYELESRTEELTFVYKKTKKCKKG